MAEFFQYIKAEEGFRAEVYDDEGSPAIGYGHRILDGESFDGGTTEEAASRVLAADLGKAAAAARRAVKQARPQASFDDLEPEQQFKLAEFSMNIGARFGDKFPKWIGAVIDGDTNVELSEYQRRTSSGKLMGPRNAAYLKFFHGIEDVPEPIEGEPRAAAEAKPSSIDDLFSDDEFLALSPAQRIERVADESIGFRALYEKDPERAKSLVESMVAHGAAEGDKDIYSSIAGGIRIGVGGSAWVMANAAMLVESLGIENDFDESWRKFANIQFIDGGNMIGSDWWDIAASVLAGLPAGLIIPGLATAAFASGLPAIGVSAGAAAFAAPALGFGLTGAVSAADRGPEAALKRGLTDAALGLIYPVTASLSRTARVAIESGAAFAVSEQEDITRRGIEALALGSITGVYGRRAPFEVMKRLGVRDKVAEAKQAMAEAARVQRANAQTMTAIDGFPLADQFGNPRETLGDAMKIYGELVRNEHPMTSRPMDRSKHELRAIADQQKNAAANEGPIATDAVPDRKSAKFAPGPEWVDHRAFTVLEETAERIIRKYKSAGAVMTPLAKAFEIPVHFGAKTFRGNLKHATGWYAFAAKGKDGKIINPQELHVRDRTNVQTLSHEFGHHVAFLDDGLASLHDYRLAKVRKDFEAIDEIATAHNVGPENVTQGGKTVDKRFTGIAIGKDGKATVSGIFKLHQEGLIPEHLQHIPELLSVSYDFNNLSEGMAEIFRLWMTNNKKFGGDVDLHTKFPKAMEALEKWKSDLPRSRRKAFERFQKDAHEHLEMNGAAAIGAVMGADLDASQVLSSRGAHLRQQFFDDTAGVMNLVQRTHGEQIPGSVAETFRLLRGLAEAGNRMVQWGAPEFIVDVNGGRMIRYTGKSLNEIFEPYPSGAAMDRFFRYEVAVGAKELKLQYLDDAGRVRDLSDLPPKARREIELRNKTREKLLTDEMIKDGIGLARDHPEYLRTHQELKDFAAKMRVFGRKGGLWNKDQEANWRRAEFTFSFFREIEAAGRGGSPSGSMLTGETPTRTLHGSTRNLRDPFSSLLETHMRTMRMALENIAKQDVAKFVDSAEGGRRFAGMLRPLANMKVLRLDEIRAAAATELKKKYSHLPDSMIDQLLERNFPHTGDLDKLTMFLGNTAPHGEGVMTVFVKGEPKYYEIIDPTLISSIRSMRRPQVVGLMKHWNNLRRVKQYFVTIAPGFMAVNFARDVLMSSIMSRTGNFHLGKAMKGLWGAITQDQDFRDFHANGGGSAGIRETPVQTRARVIAHAQRKGFDPKRLILDGASVVKALDYIGRTLEISSRLGEYKAARKQGARAQHAAYLGREVSTDFAVRGENATMRFFGNTVPFFNAMVAGGDRLYRSVRYDPSHKRATAIKMGGVAMTSMALYLLNRQIAEYRDLPDWDKWSYWHFYVPKWDDDGERSVNPDGNFAGQRAYVHMKIPKLWEVGSVGSLGERFMESLLGDDEEQDLAQDFAHILGLNFGLNLYSRSFPVPVPVGVGSVIEQYSGKILMTGNPIESVAMAQQEVWARKRASSPRVFGEVGKLLERFPLPDVLKSPARAEALLRGAFGEFAMIGAHLADDVFFPGGPEGRFDQKPIISRFYEGYGKYSKQEQQFYERLHSFKQAATTLDSMAKDPGRKDILSRWLGDPKKMRQAQLAKHYEDAQRTIAVLSGYQNDIRGGLLPLTPAEAAKQINELTQQKRFLMRTMNEMSRQLEAGK